MTKIGTVCKNSHGAQERITPQAEESTLISPPEMRGGPGKIWESYPVIPISFKKKISAENQYLEQTIEKISLNTTGNIDFPWRLSHAGSWFTGLL